MPVAVEFHHCFRSHSAGGNRTTITTPEQGGQQCFLSSSKADKVGALRLDLAECIHEARHVATAVLDTDNTRAIHRQPLNDIHPDLVGELRDVVEQDVDRGALCQLAEVVFDAFL